MCILHLNLTGHVVELCMQDDYISDIERYHAARNYQASVDWGGVGRGGDGDYC